MAPDPYAPCPCGSGKKVKFCCHSIIADMEKVAKLQENQPALALKLLEELSAKHPDNAWVATTQVTILFADRRFDESKLRLDTFLGYVSDDPKALAMHAVASLAVDGYELAKRSIHRAFQLSWRKQPDLVANVASGVALSMYHQGCHMAARQHLALALRYISDTEREHGFLRLLSLERDRNIAYPLRSVHTLAEYSGSEENLRQAQRATRLSGLGCWEPAAILFSRLAEQEPDNAVLQHNTGMCQAWDGNEVAAAESLHRAGQLYDNAESAVECEALAQLFDLENTNDVVHLVQQRFSVDGVSKLLTVLDDEPRLARVESSTSGGDPPKEETAAVYRVLEHAMPPGISHDELNRDDVPRILAELTVYDANPDEQTDAEAILDGLEGDDFAVALGHVRSAADNLLSTDGQSAEPEEIDSVSAELAELHRSWHLPAEVPALSRIRLEQSRWQHLIDEVWPEKPLAALDGRSPRQAALEPESRIQLRAAVHVFDALCHQGGHSADLSRLRSSLQLGEEAALAVDDTTPLTGLSAMQLHRVPLAELSDDQLAELVDRVVLIGHGRFIHQFMKQVAGRPACVRSAGSQRVHKTLCEVCLRNNNRSEALEWINAGREAASEEENPFETIMEWDFRELETRLVDSTDPQVPRLVQHIRARYLPKLPQIESALVGLLTEAGREDLIDEPAAVAATGTRSATDSGLWTPESGSDAGAEKKLWVPGQD